MEFPKKVMTASATAVGDGLAVFDSEQQQSFVLNATSALVFQHCDGQTSPQRMTEILRQKLNLPAAEAEKLVGLAIDELQAANLLEALAAAPAAAVTRRQMLATFAAAGLSLALAPLVARVAHAQGGHTLIPVLDCVQNNGNGTYTAHFGYVNSGSAVIDLPVGPKNMFVGGDKDRGQPTAFLPGEHPSEFTVVFDALDTLKWMLKADGDSRHQVEASATSEACTTQEPTSEPTSEPTPEPTSEPTPEPTPPPLTP
jgi:hypothetical protein